MSLRKGDRIRLINTPRHVYVTLPLPLEGTVTKSIAEGDPTLDDFQYQASFVNGHVWWFDEGDYELVGASTDVAKILGL